MLLLMSQMFNACIYLSIKGQTLSHVHTVLKSRGAATNSHGSEELTTAIQRGLADIRRLCSIQREDKLQYIQSRLTKFKLNVTSQEMIMI